MNLAPFERSISLLKDNKNLIFYFFISYILMIKFRISKKHLSEI